MAEEQFSNAAQRPESTIVQSFSADLDSMFGLNSGGSVGALQQTVEEKKQNVTSASEQLQELEAKLRETEQRLAKVSRQNSPSRPQGSNQHATSGAAAPSSSPFAQRSKYPDDMRHMSGRPPHVREDTRALMSTIPGAMPAEPAGPQNTNSDYVMVDREEERPDMSQSLR